MTPTCVSGPRVITGSSDAEEATSEPCASFEDGERGHAPRNAGGLQKLEVAGKQILPQSLRKEHSPAHTVVLAL